MEVYHSKNVSVSIKIVFCSMLLGRVALWHFEEKGYVNVFMKDVSERVLNFHPATG